MAIKILLKITPKSMIKFPKVPLLRKSIANFLNIKDSTKLVSYRILQKYTG